MATVEELEKRISSLENKIYIALALATIFGVATAGSLYKLAQHAAQTAVQDFAKETGAEKIKEFLTQAEADRKQIGVFLGGSKTDRGQIAHLLENLEKKQTLALDQLTVKHLRFVDDGHLRGEVKSEKGKVSLELKNAAEKTVVDVGVSPNGFGHVAIVLWNGEVDGGGMSMSNNPLHFGTIKNHPEGQLSFWRTNGPGTALWNDRLTRMYTALPASKVAGD